MSNEQPNKARIFLAGNLGYLESLIKQYGAETPIQEVYQKEKEKVK